MEKKEMIENSVKEWLNENEGKRHAMVFLVDDEECDTYLGGDEYMLAYCVGKLLRNSSDFAKKVHSAIKFMIKEEKEKDDE